MLILECPMKNSAGMFFPRGNLIVVENIHDIGPLLHEVTHKLFKERNLILESYLNSVGLGFDNINHEFICFYTERMPVLEDIYDKTNLYEECVCIFMQAHSNKELLKLDIPEYNQIITGEFVYSNRNGDLIDYNSGDWLLWSPEAQRIANDIIEMF